MTGFIEPMLAATMPETFVPDLGEWFAEEKFDGHRLIVRVVFERALGLFDEPVGKNVYAWSRDGLPRILPAHLKTALATLPEGTYDGELLVPGKRSYGVTALDNQADLCFICFDILELLGHDTMKLRYTERRELLKETFSRPSPERGEWVRLAFSIRVNSIQDINEFAARVWAQDGEGLIIKRGSGIYIPRKRSKDWMKLKQVRSAVLEVTGFLPGTGKKINTGNFAKVILKDENGIHTTVKTLDAHERSRIEAAAVPPGRHPWIGRKLRVNYQELTPDREYRHIRWDRWEDE